MPINNNGSGIGSGNPYFGSGFTNFENFLQPENIDWGKSQNQMVPASNDWSQQTPFDNWMINRGGGGPKAATPDLPLDDVTKPPMQTLPSQGNSGTFGLGFRNAFKPAGGSTTPNPNSYHVPDPRVPGGYDKTYTDPRLPATSSEPSAFPALDKKLQQGVW